MVRINAWSEVSAMASAFVVSVLLQLAFGYDSDKPLDFAWMMIITVGITTGVWLAVTFLTAPEPNATLVAFYRRTRPSRAGGRRSRRSRPTSRRRAVVSPTCSTGSRAAPGLWRAVRSRKAALG